MKTKRPFKVKNDRVTKNRIKTEKELRLHNADNHRYWKNFTQRKKRRLANKDFKSLVEAANEGVYRWRDAIPRFGTKLHRPDSSDIRSSYRLSTFSLADSWPNNEHNSKSLGD